MKTKSIRKYRTVRSSFPKIYGYTKEGGDYFLVDGRSKKWGLTVRKNFNNQTDALGYARELEIQILENGKSVNGQVKYQNQHVQNLIEKLQTHGKTLDDSVHFYLHHLQESLKQSVVPTINDLVERWVFDKTQNKLEPVSKRTASEYRSYKKFILHHLGTNKPPLVTNDELRQLVNQVSGGQLTRKKYLQFLKNFFNWCVKKKLVNDNPTDGIKVKVDRREVSIYTPEEVEKLLRICEEYFPSMLGYYCLCVFGGLRPSESERVHWEDLNFDGREVFVRNESKTGLRRFILKDTDTLWVWLKHIKDTRPGEPLNPTSNHSGLQKIVRRKLGLTWKQDVLRHSFGTYYHNLIHDLTRVSHDMGNSVEVCKRYYVRHCVFRCCRTPVPIHVGQRSDAVGQQSERSDARRES